MALSSNQISQSAALDWQRAVFFSSYAVYLLSGHTEGDRNTVPYGKTMGQNSARAHFQSAIHKLLATMARPKMIPAYLKKKKNCYLWKLHYAFQPIKILVSNPSQSHVKSRNLEISCLFTCLVILILQI